jgi:hypothetical protein
MDPHALVVCSCLDSRTSPVCQSRLFSAAINGTAHMANASHLFRTLPTFDLGTGLPRV